METTQNWHKADIIAAIRKTGTSLRKLSLEHGLGEGTLQQALHRPYPHAERLIAQAINEAPEKIWPSRYTKKQKFDKASTASTMSANKRADV
jgi:Ner family transcriptional regulator